MKVLCTIFLVGITTQSYSQELNLTCQTFTDKIVSYVQFNVARNCYIYFGGDRPISRRPIKIKYKDSGIETVIDSSTLSPSGWLNESEIVYRRSRLKSTHQIPIIVTNVFTNEVRSIPFGDQKSPVWLKVFDNSICFLIKRGKQEIINRWDDLTHELIEYELDDKSLTNELVFYRKLNLMLYVSVDNGTSTIKGYAPNTNTTSIFDRSNFSINHLRVDTANFKLYYIKSESFNYSDEVCVVDLRSGVQKSLGFLANGLRVGELDVLHDKLLLSINNENSGVVTQDIKDMTITLRVNTSVCTIRLN